MNGPSSAMPACCISAMARPERLAMPPAPEQRRVGTEILDLGLGVLQELQLAGDVLLLLGVVELGLEAFVSQHDAVRPHRLAPRLLDVIEGAFLADDAARVLLVQALAAALVDLVLRRS